MTATNLKQKSKKGNETDLVDWVFRGATGVLGLAALSLVGMGILASADCNIDQRNPYRKVGEEYSSALSGLTAFRNKESELEWELETQRIDLIEYSKRMEGLYVNLRETNGRILSIAQSPEFKDYRAWQDEHLVSAKLLKKLNTFYNKE